MAMQEGSCHQPAGYLWLKESYASFLLNRRPLFRAELSELVDFNCIVLAETPCFRTCPSFRSHFRVAKGGGAPLLDPLWQRRRKPRGVDVSRRAPPN